MNLNAYVAGLRRGMLTQLLSGDEPSQGRFDAEMLRQGRVKGAPQLGAVRYTPDTIALEFIFSDGGSAATIFTVDLDAPERIVWLAVPEWVVETIWQGEIDGSYHFESDAMQLLARFAAGLSAEANRDSFGSRIIIGRE